MPWQPMHIETLSCAASASPPSAAWLASGTRANKAATSGTKARRWGREQELDMGILRGAAWHRAVVDSGEGGHVDPGGKHGILAERARDRPAGPTSAHRPRPDAAT